MKHTKKKTFRQASNDIYLKNYYSDTMKIKLMHSLTASKCPIRQHTQRADVEKALVEETINSLDYGKTAGLDVFPYKFYKIFKETLISIYYATFTMVLNMVTSQDIWHNPG